LPETLIDAELFGNAKSYPNPGMAARPGLVGEAHGSTLFLDELAELPHAAQAHLLRVLDRGEYQRLGDAQVRVSDFRVIAATNRDLSSLKPDLLARFTLRIAVPDLNARKEDVPLLARHLLRRMAERGDPAALALFPGGDPRAEPRVPLPWMIGLLEHPFRTNVRELEAMLVAALATPEVAGPWVKAEGDVRRPELSAPDGGHVDAVSAEAIRQCLDANNGSIEHTWRALGLSSRFTLLRLIKKHGLEVRRRPARGRGPVGGVKGGGLLRGPTS
jgi:two-component system nitrogen regulation response regulator GlnG/two-component system response regulator HydG